jgi:hypothetical protein
MPTQSPPSNDPEGKRQQPGALLVATLVGLALLWLVQDFVVAPLAMQSAVIPYSEFRQKLADGQLSDVTVGDGAIMGDMKNPTPQASPATLPSVSYGGGGTTKRGAVARFALCSPQARGQ